MSALALMRSAEADESRAEAPQLLVVPGGRDARSLDDVIAATWASVRRGEDVSCPVCRGALAPRWSAGSGVVGGACRDCGALLD